MVDFLEDVKRLAMEEFKIELFCPKEKSNGIGAKGSSGEGMSRIPLSSSSKAAARISKGGSSMVLIAYGEFVR